MRKRVFGRQFNRSKRSRTALFRSLVSTLVQNGKIQTTETKAKALQQEIDKLFQLLRKNTLASRRTMVSRLGNDVVTTDLLFKKYADLANSRTSGFTTVTRVGERRGDNTKMAVVELINIKVDKPEETAVETK